MDVAEIAQKLQVCMSTYFWPCNVCGTHPDRLWREWRSINEENQMQGERERLGREGREKENEIQIMLVWESESARLCDWG